MSSWSPIIPSSSPTGMLAWDSIHAITDAIVELSCSVSPHEDRKHPKHEEALLYGYLAMSQSDSKWALRSTDRLNDCIDGVRGVQHRLALFGGLCGLGWSVEHLGTRLVSLCNSDDEPDSPTMQYPLEVNENSDPAEDIDRFVIQQLRKRHVWLDHYDLIGGLVGIGVYLLERLPEPSAVDGLHLILEHLDRIATRHENHVSWFTDARLLPEWQREQCPGGYYNLGVAHGVPGIIYLLNELCAAGIDETRARPMLEGSVDWLIAQRRPAESSSWFSTWSAPGYSTDSRLTWCYGDLGVVAILSQVARKAGRQDWKDFAAGLLDNCLARSVNFDGISDAALCHGAVGLAHVFNRIFQTTGDDRCRTASLSWFERALEMRQPGTGVGGFSAYRRPDLAAPPVMEATPAFLDGAIGIALALLAALTPVEPGWDRLLLLSGQPGPLVTSSEVA